MRPVLRVPLLGTIPAGLPESAMAEAEETVAVDQTHCTASGNNPLFALRVSGVSMIGAAIKPDDIAIFEIREPRVGDIVAALVDGGVTLKRLAHDGSQFVLHGENPEYPEIRPRDELQVQGVLVNIQRAVN
jgi:SOS-response transcriptional repressor LexA